MKGQARRAAPIVIGVLGVAILIALGVWQTQRLAWKEALITEIDQRALADPVAIPEVPDAEAHNLLRVRAQGMIGTDEIHILHSIKRFGPGFRIVVPMTLDQPQGRRILVDLGFVPQRFKARGERPRLVTSAADQRVEGLLLWPNEADSYTPVPDLGRNLWFARDVVALADALETEPVLLVAAEHPGGTLPLPLPPGTDLPNRHLEYAVTWFSLAAVWAVMSVVWLRLELRRTHKG